MATSLSCILETFAAVSKLDPHLIGQTQPFIDKQTTVAEQTSKSFLLASLGEVMIYVYAVGLLAYDCIEYRRWYTGAAILIPLAIALWRFRSLRRPKKVFIDDHTT